jgi:PKD repeat protein
VAAGQIRGSLDWSTTRANLDLTLDRGNADGSWTTIANARTSNRPEVVTYAAAAVGKYRFVVRAAKGGSTFTLTRSTPDPVAPGANFSATPTTGTAPLAVAFHDSSTGTVTGWSWTFGDGASSTSPSPSHTYAAAGMYTVALTASGPGGQSTQTKTDYITVSAAPPPPGQAPPFLTLLLSRTAVTAADACVANDAGVARLDTVVAPELARRGLAATGTVQINKTPETGYGCIHYQETLEASWSLLATLRDSFGFTFVSHSRTYNKTLASASPQVQWDETCGTLLDLQAHGHMRGDGLFAWPDNSYDVGVQTNVVATCFAFGRQYSALVNARAEATAPPYWQRTLGTSGGRCNNAALSCSSMQTETVYRSPVKMAQTIAGLQTDQWFTMQSYLFVTGARDGLWDCTAPNWQDHWTSDTERYCWNDYQTILDSIPTNVIVTDPKTVAQAWGRTNYAPPSP